MVSNRGVPARDPHHLARGESRVPRAVRRFRTNVVVAEAASTRGAAALDGRQRPGILERVVEFGDEWFPKDYHTPEELAVRIKQLQETAERAGRQPIPVNIFGPSPSSTTRSASPRLVSIGSFPTSRQPIRTPSWRRSTSSPSSGTRSCAKQVERPSRLGRTSLWDGVRAPSLGDLAAAPPGISLHADR